MQYSGHLDINPQPGRAISQIPTGWFKYVNNVLRFLQVRNGRLIVDNDKWTIECGGGAFAAHWSGRVFFGGALVYSINLSELAAFQNTHVKVNLRTGAVTGEDWNETDTSNLNEYEYYSVKTKTQDEEGNNVYTLNNHTVGDIRCRIT